MCPKMAWERMARDIPRQAHTGIPKKKRFSFLRTNLMTGRDLGVYDKTARRYRFSVFRMIHLPELETQDCYLCGKEPEHWHHIVQMCMGGADHRLNLVPLCKPCHRRVHRHSIIRGNRVERPYHHIPVLLKPKIEFEYIPPQAVIT